MLGAAIGIVYTILDSINQLYVSIPFYVLLILLCGVVFWINRSGRYMSANFIFLPLLLFLIYVFADNDVNHTGVGAYFIVYSLISLTLCGWEQVRLGILFSALGVAGFFVAYYIDLPPIIEPVPYSSAYINVSFITNFLVTLCTSLALLFFSLDINYKTEQELISNNQLLTKANLELDRFVYSASHDLRAPLSSVLGLIEICQRSGDREEVKQCLDMMKTRVADLDSFIGEIIDYSRNARQEVRIENFNLLELVHEVTEGLKFGTGMENIFIDYSIPPALKVTSDRSRLKVVLNNIIGNALKYSNPRHDKPQIVIKASSMGNFLKMEVEDNGIGIGEEHLPKIFNMFYRASERSQGSGLGLYIVKETLDKLNGTILVKSTYGHGSMFSIEIPCAV
ncbi:hypothetical protein WSM22_13210 [Cytophagales bacterium WSM2-2]|nr:hypothetical protein WSM22_13210 [Cytophagales bacterium WSM2-2]